MTKADLVGKIADGAGINKKQADAALGAMIDAIKGALKKGDSVQIIGFGTFEVRKRAARTGRNPRSGAAIKIKAAKVPAFRAGTGLKDAVK